MTTTLRFTLMVPLIFSLAAPLIRAAETARPVFSPETTDLGFSLPSFKAGSAPGMSGLEISSPLSGLHKGLGYTTVAMGLLTGLLNPEVVGYDLHHSLGLASAGLAAATMGVGFLSHYRDVSIRSGFNSNNIHALLGITGGAMMILAPFIAPAEGHQVLGELGALTMGLSIVGKLVF